LPAGGDDDRSSGAFAPITLDDKAEAAGAPAPVPAANSATSFASLCAWSNRTASAGRAPAPTACGSAGHGPAGGAPLRLGPWTACLDALAEARRLPYSLKLLSVAGDFLATHPALASHFDAVEDVEGANYLYRARDLADLPGRRYAKKRNLIAQFEAHHPDHVVAPLDAGCHDACREVLRAIARAATGDDVGASLRDEAAALDATMAAFETLEQAGVLVRVDGRPVAFSVFERLDADVAAVHFEKADRAFKGLYQVVNRASARAIAALGCGIVNREEDLGDEGLRQAKRSYHPIEIAPLYDLTLRA
jgi:hypothetical protein